MMINTVLKNVLLSKLIRNEWAKRIVFLFSCYVCLTALFTGLTLLHGRISPVLTSKNMNKSLEILDREGNYLPFIGVFSQKRSSIFAGEGDIIDNFTTMWMVQGLDSEHFFDAGQYSQGLPYNAENRLPIEGGKNTQVFRSSWEDGNYWSGYRLFFKPLMIFFDLWGMRILQLLLVVTSAVCAFVSIRRNIGFIEAALLIISILAVNPLNMIIDFDQAPDIIQALFSSITVLWLLRRKTEEKWMLAYFLSLGMIEIFINCLIMPLVTLGIPLITYCLYKFKQNVNPKKQIFDLLSLSVVWGMGYAGTFMSSWIISALFKHQSPVNSVAGGIKAFFFRAGIHDENIIMTVARSIHGNINRNIPFLWLILLFAGILIAALVKNKHQTVNLLMLLPLLIVSIYPFLWIVILSNHSSIHSWMVHDIFIVSIWGLLLTSYYLTMIYSQ